MPTVSTVANTGDPYIDGVLAGVKWGVSTLTFSFPTDLTYYGSGYANGEPANGFQAFNTVQQAAITSILQMYSSVANINFVQITETSTQHADLRYAESNSPSTAWAYYPSSSSSGGDAWFNNSTHYYDNPVLGNYAWSAMMHETGHALGLKHPQDFAGVFGTEPLDHDSLEYTVMSYRSFIGAGTSGYTNAYGSYPQSLMMLDIAAIQTLYGADYQTNSGATVYKWDPLTGREYINGVAQALPAANKIFMTVWDGGGHDTYDFSNYTTNLSVDLRPGNWTTVSATQLANLGGGHNAVGNIANALLHDNNTASLIEDAVGGSGNDTIYGNDANNALTGGAGNDLLDGGAGTDTAVFSGKASDYQLTHNADGSWTVTDIRASHADGVDTLNNIEFAQFSDTTISIANTAFAISAPTISSFSDDTGTAGDRITKDNTLTLSGTAQANSTVKLYDSGTLIGTATVDSAGAWTFTTSPLANGVHNLVATSVDSQGNVSASSTALSITVDTVAPTTPTITGVSPDSYFTGDGVTNANVLTLTGTAEANSTVKVYDGTTLLGVATAGSNGVWTYVTSSTTTGAAFGEPGEEDTAAGADAIADADSASGTAGTLADGAHRFTVVAVDAAGNTSVASNALNVTVDTVTPVAPAITTISPDTGVSGDFVTSGNVLTVSGTAEAKAVIQVYYNGANLLGTAMSDANGNWSLTTPTMPNGNWVLTASATDAAGNVSILSSARTVKVDTVAPTKPVIVSVSPDSGTVGDGVTSANTLSVTGTAEANSTVKIYDGATLLGSTTANGSGAWSFTTATLADGAHSLTAKASDAAGNTSVASTAATMTIDTTAPSTAVITAVSPDSGTVGDGVTNANVLTVTGTAEANSIVKVYDGATLLGSATANSSGVWSYTTATLSDGAHNLTAKATDAAGNTGAASAATTVTIDTAAPSAAAITAVSPDSGTIGDGVTNANVLTVTGTAQANSIVKVYDGATLLGSTTANSNGTWSYTTATLSDGNHSLTVTATDAAGNTSVASAATNVKVDTVAPSAAVITAISPDDGAIGDGVTNAHVLTVTGTAEANSTVKVYDGATLLGSATANSSGAWSYTTNTLLDGAHSFTAKVTDAAGNTGAASAAANMTIATAAPSAAVITGISSDDGAIGNGLTNDNTLTVTGTAEANSTVKIYDGATLLGSATANSNGTWSYTSNALSDGAHSLTATATNAAGNTSPASAVANVTIDTAAPLAAVITAVSPDTGAIADGVTSASVLTMTGTAEANSTVKIYDGATLLGSTTANSSGMWSYTTAALSDGAHSLTARATDAAGNTGAASVSTQLTVDTTAPSAAVITAISPESNAAAGAVSNADTLTVSGLAEAGSTVRVYDGAVLLGTASADASGAWSYVASALKDGGHSFTAVAVDAAGNVGSSSAAASVTVDTVAPTGPTIADVSSSSGAVTDGTANASALTISGVAEANSVVNVYDGATLIGHTTASIDGTWSYSATALQDGVHNFTAKATDLAGNVSSSSAAFTVAVDTVAPSAPTIATILPDSGTVGDGVTSSNKLTLTGAAEAGSVVKIYDGATLLGQATANASGSWSFATAKLTDGSHSFSVKATDAAGNISATSTSQTMTVDTAAPSSPTISLGQNSSVRNIVNVTGSAEANSSVKVYDGNVLLGSVKADGNGNWSFTTQALTDGGHNLRATSTDAAGNTGASSTVLNVAINPAVTTPVIASSAAGSQNGVLVANSLMLGGTADANSVVKIYDGATLLGSATTDSSGVWSYRTSALSATNHSFTAVVTDPVTNASVTSAALAAKIANTYDSAGRISSETITYSDQSREVINFGITGQRWTTTDTLYAANGKPVSQVLMNGATTVQTQTWNADGTIHDIHYYGIAGQAYTDYEVAYGANNKPASALYSNGMTATWSYNSDGSLHELVYNGITGQRWTTTDTLYAANGKPVSQVWSNGGTTIQTQTWNADGTIHDVRYYGITGQPYTEYAVVYGANNKPASASYSNGMTATWSYNSDGSLHELVYDGITGARWTTTDTVYGANGKAVSQVWSYGGTVIQTQTWNADGTVHDIHYYGVTGQAYTHYDVVYGANNKPASALYSNGMTATWSYSSDGSYELVYNGITGQKWTTTDTLYGANGRPLSQVWSNGGTVIQSQTWNADGTIHDIHYYGITGQPYTEYVMSYGANNKLASALYSNGMTTTWSYNSDGSLHEVVTTGITGARWTTTDTLYGANGKPVSQVWSNGGTVIQTETWNADGTIHDIHYYGITGQAYTDYDVVYGANNKPASASYSNGMTATWSYNSDGSLHELVYDGITGQKWTTTDTLYGANGKAVSQVWVNGGTVIQSQTWNADGTIHDIHYYGVTGQAYTDYYVLYGPNQSPAGAGGSSGAEFLDGIPNKPTIAFYSNGMTITWSYNSDGSLHEQVTDGISGQKWSTIDTVYGDNGKVVSQVWSNGGTTVQSQTWNSDGTTHDIHYYGVTGQAYTDYDVVYANNKAASASYSNGMTAAWTYNSDGSLQQVEYHGMTGLSYNATRTVYGASGAVVEIDTTFNDGSRTVAVKAADMTLYSTAANETFTSYGQNNTFNFKAGLGNDVINNFKSGEQSGHDIIQIDGNLAHDMSDVVLTQVGNDVKVAFQAHDDAIVVKNVQVADIYHSFAFV